MATDPKAQLLALGICLHRSPRRHHLVSGYFPSRAAMNWGPAVFQAPPPSIGSGCLSSRAVFKWGPATFNWFRLSFKPRHLLLGSGYLASRAAITWFPAIFQAAPPSTGVHLSFTTSALPPIRPFVTSPDRFLERNSDRELRWREKPMGYFKLTRVLASAPDSSGRNTQNGQIVTLQTPEFQRYDSHVAVFLMENVPKTRNRNVGYFLLRKIISYWKISNVTIWSVFVHFPIGKQQNVNRNVEILGGSATLRFDVCCHISIGEQQIVTENSKM